SSRRRHTRFDCDWSSGVCSSDLSFSIMQRHADLGWRTQADIIFEPDVKQFVWDDFTKTPDMVAAGEIAALHALPQIRAALRGEKIGRASCRERGAAEWPGMSTEA